MKMHVDLLLNGNFECQECGYRYRNLLKLTEAEVGNLLLADMHDCDTCNTILPLWATTKPYGTPESASDVRA